MDWSIVPGGQEVYCLRASFTGNHSAARGMSVPVTPGQQYDVSIAMRTGGEYWTCSRMEALWRDGIHPVEDYLMGSPPGWQRIQKFDGYCGPAVNFDPTWQLYYVRNITPASDAITIALATGGLNNSQAVELFWDNLNVIPSVYALTHADSHPALSRHQRRWQGQRVGPVRVLTRLAGDPGNRLRAVSMRPGDRPCGEACMVRDSYLITMFIGLCCLAPHAHCASPYGIAGPISPTQLAQWVFPQVSRPIPGAP